MGFREMIKKVQQYSGFSDAESKESLEMLVETLAAHLNEGERKDFASQLPPELKGIALSVLVTEDNSNQDIIDYFISNQAVSAEHAKKQVLSAWKALKDSISPGEIDDIWSQLPKGAKKLLGNC